jgi:hypothetical protein
MPPHEVRGDLQAVGLEVLEEIGIGYGPPRLAGREWLPHALVMRLDAALSRLAKGNRAGRWLRPAADIQLWVVRSPAVQGPAA